MQILDCIHKIRERSSFCTNYSTAVLITFYKAIHFIITIDYPIMCDNDNKCKFTL